MKRALLALLLASAAHAETRPRYGGAIEASLLGAPVSLDPAYAQSHAEIAVAQLVFDTLYALDTLDGTARPHLATQPPVLDGARTTARITLARGAHFHDGSEVTAQDVALSLERARKGPARYALSAISSIKADTDSVELTMRAPLPDLATRLALPQLSITKNGRAPSGDRPIGSGPFAVDRIDRTKGVLTLRAFDDHFAGRPYLDTLALRWFSTADGEARGYETNAAQLSARGTVAFAGGTPMYRANDLEGPASVLAFVGFGKAHADVTSSVAFRKALDLAIGRGALTTITSGERVVPTTSPVPIEAGGMVISATARTGDAVAAQKLLPPKIPKLEILIESTRPDDRELAERVLRALDKLGIASTITALPAIAMKDRIAKGQADLWIGQIAAPATSAVAWWGAAFAAGGDDWFAQKLAAGALDTAATTKAFGDRQPIVPLMFRAVRISYRTDVYGLAFDAYGRPGFANLSLFGDPVKAKKK